MGRPIYLCNFVIPSSLAIRHSSFVIFLGVLFACLAERKTSAALWLPKSIELFNPNGHFGILDEFQITEEHGNYGACDHTGSGDTLVSLQHL